VARAIDALGQDPAQACYPRRPDTSRRATVTAATTPGASPASLNVTCRTELTTVPGGFWKLTLTVEWGAPGDPATTGTTWMYLDPGGGPGQIFSSGNPLY
jgi:hypothetical protein